MLLPLCHNSFPPFKPLPNPSAPIPLSPNTLVSQNPKITPKFSLLRTSAATSSTIKIPHQSPIKRIADKLRSLGYTEEDPKETPKENTDDVSAGEIFIPLPKHLRKYRVGHTIDTSWSSPENPVPEPGLGKAIQRFHGLRRRVMKEKKEEKEKRKAGQGREAAAPTVAELTLPAEELRRLRALGIELRKKIKAGKAGITEGIVNGIHERWRRAEVVKIVCEDICRLNMQRTHDRLERKTGGLVIWRSGGNIILYRGANYKYPYFLYDNNSTNYTSAGASPSSSMDSRVHFRDERCSSGEESTNSVGPHSSNKMGQLPLIQGVGSPNKVRFQLPGEAQLAEEAGSQLDGLGPRFTDWWGYDPLPVDADLLPAIVPGYRKPFRLLPYGVKPKLTNDEMTILKRLGRPLPCHFVLGRNRKLQGLAAAMLKLWEKCEIAKIAVKRGVQNTRSELMAEELKLLTGGILLSRDKEIIVFYRGKDFLPAAVSSAIEERRKCAIPREKHSTDCSSSVMARQRCEVGMVNSRRGDKSYGITDEKRYLVSRQRKLRFAEAAVKKTSMKLQMALEKKAGAERLLAELDRKEIPREAEVDKEGITEEERYMLRKCGLRMKPFLLLGRRGVFDGTVENMHLHWKYRELVKVICGGRSIEEARGIAESLEAESGGILVAVERVNKGYAIIVYRGKNYKRPSRLRPQTLLNKRQAMMRSLEAQRRESLKLHVLKLSRNIEELKLQLAKDQETNKLSAKELNSQLVEEEEETDKRCLLEYNSSDADVLPNYCSSSVIPSGSEENVEGRERSGADSSSLTSYDGIDAPMGSPETSQQGMLRGFSLVSEDKEDGFKITEPVPVTESVLKVSGVLVSKKGQDGDVESLITPADPTAMIPSVESPKSGTELSACDAVNNLSMKVPFRAARISNRRDRLLLRKQALKMRYRHVLAVDSSNIATGVAKSIQTHFKKHPFAIVNVKGRPKGTSVHAVVLELEQATGGVLVSQEPSKVILYRGWGAMKEPGKRLEINAKDVWKRPSASTEGEAARPVVSPELMSAIRFGSGLQRETEVGEEISP